MNKEERKQYEYEDYLLDKISVLESEEMTYRTLGAFSR